MEVKLQVNSYHHFNCQYPEFLLHISAEFGILVKVKFSSVVK
jgi:hypothetical protein